MDAGSDTGSGVSLFFFLPIRKTLAWRKRLVSIKICTEIVRLSGSALTNPVSTPEDFSTLRGQLGSWTDITFQREEK